ncbi:SpoIID/LytB domain-containing protein [Nocardioides mangrovicus]|uniref:SpoIID/LytB domain-containing protein n=1 Tax=Nocardioides mangrovicus TaxID=2478913 RepID=UPI001314556E|nr:SpoIID/LytB domain-containing protein [Nocardioides mangrovicus]
MTALLLAGSIAPATAMASAAPAPTPSGAKSQLSVTGNGFGHGRGLSQWGAYGRAKAGQSYAAILAAYYPGTTLTRSSGAVRVLLTDAARFVTVKPAARLRVHAVGGRTYRIGHRGVTAWRLRPYVARTAVQYKKGGRWHRYRWIPGTTNEFLSSAGRLVLVTPSGAVTYRGRMRSIPAKLSGSRAVNIVALDAYVRGVVPVEMPSTWSTEALKAQAVAARTYALYARGHAGTRDYDLCDTTACQVYRGTGAEQTSTNAAVAATRGRVLSNDGSVAFTEFSSSNGGWTAGSTLAPTPQQDPYDTAYRHWTATIDTSKLDSTTHGAVTAIAVASRDNSASSQEWGGRVLTMTVTYADGSTASITGDKFRSTYGLRSTWFTFS